MSFNEFWTDFEISRAEIGMWFLTLNIAGTKLQQGSDTLRREVRIPRYSHMSNEDQYNPSKAFTRLRERACDRRVSTLTCPPESYDVAGEN